VALSFIHYLVFDICKTICHGAFIGWVISLQLTWHPSIWTRHDALFREVEAAATLDQAAKTVSAMRSLRLSLDRRSTSGFGRFPQGPIGGPEQSTVA
jgi:hypothetical protein